MTTATNGTTYLYLIRHGATEANERRPYVLQGCGIDMPLSPTGRRQAVAVADFLSQRSLQGIYSSPLKRAVETAEMIASRHRVDVSTQDNLKECHVGQWEGKDWDWVKREDPEAYRAFINDPAENPYLGGESFGDVLRRIEPALTELMQRHVGGSIAVVAHSVVNRAYLAHLLGLNMRQARQLSQMNTGVNVVRYRDGETRLLTLNAHFHLDGVSPYSG
jgi:broad specificity phosphatase PhoE